MLPAPASSAAPPRPKSRPSWIPAVPPPPVAGAPVGTGTVAVGVAVGVVVADGDAVGDAVGLAEGLADGLADGLGLALGPRAVPLKNPVGEAVAPAAGVPVVVQAEMAVEATMAATPQPMAVNRALSPVRALVVPTVMEPPHASARWRPRFPGPRKRRRP